MIEKRHQIVVRVEGQEFHVEVGDLNASPVTAIVDGREYQVFLEAIHPEVEEKPLEPAAPSGESRPRRITSRPQAGAGVVRAPMPGNIVDVKVQPRQTVKTGDPLCVLDAMKMKNIIYSPQDGRVVSVEVRLGQAVEYGTVLVRLE